jgi:hypothetical protein
MDSPGVPAIQPPPGCWECPWRESNPPSTGLAWPIIPVVLAAATGRGRFNVTAIARRSRGPENRLIVQAPKSRLLRQGPGPPGAGPVGRQNPFSAGQARGGGACGGWLVELSRHCRAGANGAGGPSAGRVTRGGGGSVGPTPCQVLVRPRHLCSCKPRTQRTPALSADAPAFAPEQQLAAPPAGGVQQQHARACFVAGSHPQADGARRAGRGKPTVASRYATAASTTARRRAA